MHLQPWPSAIKLSLSRQRLRSPISTLTADMNVWEIRGDAMPVAHINAGTDINSDIGSDVNRDVARTGLQIGIATVSSGVHQLERNSSGSGLHSRRGHAVEFNRTRAGVGTHPGFRRRQMNAAPAGFDIGRATD